MKLDNDILSELQQLSPVLAKLPKTSVFVVPEDYFDSLGANVLLALKEEFVAHEELKDNDVPAGYFENLSSTILNKIKEQQRNTQKSDSLIISSMLQSVQHSNQFQVPGEYFANLPSEIVNKINQQSSKAVNTEREELSSLLYGLRYTNVFELPHGYFDTLPGNIVSSIRTKPAKVVGMPKRKLIFRYAAAAVITGAMALGVYNYLGKPAVFVTPIGGNNATLNASIEKGKTMSEAQFNETLNNLTKEDITNYLEKNGADYDISMLTPNIDDDELPKKDEYLLDDKTLENYLDEIKFQN